ncbi:LysR family transcriptional regulator [Paenibacillus sp. MBLB4367]|uniref:LysR family transcriptional regulator n=1 Tax=Paenibacillus sp. MBLB4367 TaxID=3384767 RepID=UPI003907FB2F
MELLQLHYFRTVARLEHMTKAAEELRIAQPALSKTIARLEEDLGVSLFDRQGRQIRLNAIGKAFLEKTEVALTALEEGRREAADLAGLEKGRVSLATSTLNRLSEPLSAFRVLHPEVNFRITQASMEGLAQLAGSGEIDFCFTAMPIERPGIREMPVLQEEIYLAVPPGHRFAERRSISLREVAEEPFVGYKAGCFFQSLNDAICREAGISPTIVCEVDEPAAVGSLVRAGLGVAIVGACKKDDRAYLPMLHIENPVCRRTFRLAWHENHYLSKAARAFRDFVAAYYADPISSEVSGIKDK